MSRRIVTWGMLFSLALPLTIARADDDPDNLKLVAQLEISANDLSRTPADRSSDIFFIGTAATATNYQHVFKTLEDLLSDPCPGIRITAAASLGDLAWQFPDCNDRAYYDLRQIMRDRPDPDFGVQTVASDVMRGLHEPDDSTYPKAAGSVTAAYKRPSTLDDGANQVLAKIQDNNTDLTADPAKLKLMISNSRTLPALVDQILRVLQTATYVAVQKNCAAALIGCIDCDPSDQSMTAPACSALCIALNNTQVERRAFIANSLKNLLISNPSCATPMQPRIEVLADLAIIENDKDVQKTLYDLYDAVSKTLPQTPAPATPPPNFTGAYEGDGIRFDCDYHKEEYTGNIQFNGNTFVCTGEVIQGKLVGRFQVKSGKLYNFYATTDGNDLTFVSAGVPRVLRRR